MLSSSLITLSLERARSVYRCFLYLMLQLGMISICLNFGAWAQSQDYSTKDMNYAQSQLKKGQRLLRKRQYKAALPYFKRSHERVPDVKTVYTIGAIYKKLRRCPDAFAAWTEAERLCNTCALSQQITESLLKYTADCSGEVSIQSLPKAAIIIDGKPSGFTPFNGRLLLGSHYIELRAAAHHDIRRREVLAAGRSLQLDITMTPDGPQLGVAEPVRPIPSPHVPELSPPRATEPTTQWLSAEEVSRKPKGSGSRGLKIGMNALSAALLLTSIGLWTYSYTEKASILEEAEQIPKTGTEMNRRKIQELRDRRDSAKTIYNTSFVIGGISAGLLTLSIIVF